MIATKFKSIDEMTLTEEDRVYKLIESSMHDHKPGLTRAEIRKLRSPGSSTSIQGLIKRGLIEKSVNGRYVVKS